MGVNTKSFDNASDMITFSRASGAYGLTKVSYGPELVTNGDFATDSDWSKGTGWTIAGGVASFSGGTGADLTQTGLNVEANKAYQISFDMTQISGGGFRVVVDTSGSFVSQYFTTTAQHTVVFAVGATSTRLRLSTLGGANLSIDNISVKEVTYNSSAADATLQLTYHPNDFPRIEYALDGTAKGLLVEEARTNLVTYSEQLDQWGGNIVEPNLIVSPDRQTTADKLLSSTGSGFQRITINVSGLSSGSAYTMSCFMKSGEYTKGGLSFYDGTAFAGRVLFNLDDGTVESEVDGTASIKSVGNGWYLCSVTGTLNASVATAFISVNSLYSYTGNGGGIYVWGAQFEAGSFPTSYIKTEGATATRSADVASIPVADFGYNQSEGTVVVEASTVSTAQTNHTDLRIKDGSAFPLVSSGSRVGGSSEGTYSLYSPLTTILVNVSSVLTEGSTYKSAYRLADNDVALSVNGSTVATDTSVSFTSLTAEAIEIGDGYGYLNGHIKSIKYYPRRLTNAQLQELTT